MRVQVQPPPTAGRARASYMGTSIPSTGEGSRNAGEGPQEVDRTPASDRRTASALNQSREESGDLFKEFLVRRLERGKHVRINIDLSGHLAGL